MYVNNKIQKHDQLHRNPTVIVTNIRPVQLNTLETPPGSKVGISRAQRSTDQTGRGIITTGRRVLIKRQYDREDLQREKTIGAYNNIGHCNVT